MNREAGVEALARALHKASIESAFGAYTPHQASVHKADAAQILAALSPADKLAIAGITEERLGEAIMVAAWGYNFDPPDAARIGAELAPKVLARLTTPVSDDTEGAG